MLLRMDIMLVLFFINSIDAEKIFLPTDHTELLKSINFSKGVENHGCWCSGKFTGDPVDGLDEICKMWLIERTCIGQNQCKKGYFSLDYERVCTLFWIIFTGMN